MREYAEIMNRQLSKYYEIEAANWKNMERGEVDAAKVILDAIAKENKLLSLTREHFDRLKREKEEKKKSKAEGMLIEVIDYTKPEPDDPASDQFS